MWFTTVKVEWPKANDERQRHYFWWAEVDDSDRDDSSSEEDSHAARVGDKPKKGQGWQHKKQKVDTANSASEKQCNIPAQPVATQVEMDQAKQIQELQEQVAKLTQKQTSGGHANNAGDRQNRRQYQPN